MAGMERKVTAYCYPSKQWQVVGSLPKISCTKQPYVRRPNLFDERKDFSLADSDTQKSPTMLL